MENEIESLRDDKLRFDSWIEAAESERKCHNQHMPDIYEEIVLKALNHN